MDTANSLEFSPLPSRVSPDSSSTTMSTSRVEASSSSHSSVSSIATISTANKSSIDFVSTNASSVTNTSSNLIPVNVSSSTVSASPLPITHHTILNTPTITLSSNALASDARTSNYSAKISSTSSHPTVVQSGPDNSTTTSSGLCSSSLRAIPSITSVTLLSSSSNTSATTDSILQSDIAPAAAAFQSTTAPASSTSLNTTEGIQTSTAGGADIMTTAVGTAPTACSTPILPSTMHVPRGAAVAAHISNRSSQAVSANVAQRASLPNRGIHLATGNWSRQSNTIITCGTTSSSSSLVTSLATTTATINTSKFTRLPLSGTTGMGRTAASLTTSASIIRPTSLTRVISTSSIVNNGSSTSSTTTPRSLPCGSSSSPGVRAAAVVAPARAVLTQTRSPTGSVRPPTVGTIGQPIRLSQATLPSSQRPVAPYNLSTVQRPTQPLSLTGAANIRARTSANPRLSSQGMPTSQASINLQHNPRGALTCTNITTPSSISSTIVHTPARPQSNPGLSSTVVCPAQCGNRPASTGPVPVTPLPASSVRPVAAVHTTPAAVRPAGLGRGGFTGSHSTTFIRAETGIGLRATQTVGIEAKTGTSQTTRLQHPSQQQQQQQFLHMVNAPTVQKVSSNAASNSSVMGGSVSIIGARAPNLSTVGGAPSIAVRISSSSGVTSGVATVQPTSGSLAQASGGAGMAGRVGSRQAELHTTLIVPGGGKGSNTAAASSAASAAAAVLPPGTTITPTLAPPTHQRTEPPPTAQTSVFLHKGPPGGVTGTPGQFNLSSQPHYYVENKQSSCVTVGSGRINSSGGQASSRRPGEATPHQQQAASGGSPASKPTASPRPSILRKRHDYDNGGSNKACKNLTSALSASGGGRSSSPPSPKGTDSGGNSGASTGSATLSANSSPGLLIEEGESLEEPRPPPPAIAALPDGISPRKKPRKQQLTGNELLDAQHSSDEEDERPTRHSKRVKRDAEYEEDMDCINCSWSGEGSMASRAPSFSHRSASRPSQSSRSSAFSGPNAANTSRLVSPRAALNARNPNSDNVSNAKNTHVMAPLPHLAPSNWSSGGKNVNKSNADTSTSNSSSVGGTSINAANNTVLNSENEFVEKVGRIVKQEERASRTKKRGRNKMSLIKSYEKNWKSRINHFDRHSEVNVKPERTKVATFSDSRKKKHTLQKLEGWKVVHVGGQVSDMVDVEKEVSSRLHDILGTLEAHNKSPRKLACSKDFDQICELIKANVQRSKIIHDQMDEAKSQMSKLIAHKAKVAQIMIKYSSKRQLRKKDKK